MALVTIEKLDPAAIAARGIDGWPVWAKEVSRFDWTYAEQEQCLILEGEVTVETAEGDYRLVPGDFATFARGLSCVWNVTKDLKKRYSFG